MGLRRGLCEHFPASGSGWPCDYVLCFRHAPGLAENGSYIAYILSTAFLLPLLLQSEYLTRSTRLGEGSSPPSRS